MGAKLVKYYQYAKEQGGVKAKMRLVMVTTMAEYDAEAAPDSPELVAKFRTKLADILGKEVPTF
ncbi:MAG: hypothetical protein R3B13_20440 [Polyangiaceae bacterium]